MGWGTTVTAQEMPVRHLRLRPPGPVDGADAGGLCAGGVVGVTVTLYEIGQRGSHAETSPNPGSDRFHRVSP